MYTCRRGFHMVLLDGNRVFSLLFCSPACRAGPRVPKPPYAAPFQRELIEA